MMVYFRVPGYFPENIEVEYFEINKQMLRGS